MPKKHLLGRQVVPEGKGGLPLLIGLAGFVAVGLGVLARRRAWPMVLLTLGSVALICTDTLAGSIHSIFGAANPCLDHLRRSGNTGNLCPIASGSAPARQCAGEGDNGGNNANQPCRTELRCQKDFRGTAE